MAVWLNGALSSSPVGLSTAEDGGLTTGDCVDPVPPVPASATGGNVVGCDGAVEGYKVSDELLVTATDGNTLGTEVDVGTELGGM